MKRRPNTCAAVGSSKVKLLPQEVFMFSQEPVLLRNGIFFLKYHYILFTRQIYCIYLIQLCFFNSFQLNFEVLLEIACR